VAEQASGFALYEPSDGHEGLGHPGFGISVPVFDGPDETGGDTAGFFERGLLVVAHSINS